MKAMGSRKARMSTIEEELYKAKDTLHIVSDLFLYMSKSKNVQDMFELFHSTLVDLFRPNFCTIYYCRECGHCTGCGLTKAIVMHSTLDIFDADPAENLKNITRKLSISPEPFILNSSDTSNFRRADIYDGFVLPVKVKGRCKGFIVVGYAAMGEYSTDDYVLCQLLIRQLEICMENLVLYTELELLANTDSLTKVYNRAYFTENIELLYESEQLKQVAILDIDYFKKVNDTYGHLAGDVILKEVAQLVKGTLGEDCIVARYGGEEFAVLSYSDKVNLADALDRARSKIESHNFSYMGNIINVTISGGVANSSEGTSASSTLKLADERLYKAKQYGRNQILSS